MSGSHSKTNFFLLSSLVLFWGASYPINKIGLYYTTPFNFNELRFLIGAIAILMVVLFTKSFVLPQKRDWPVILTMAIFQMGLQMNLSNYGLSLTGAGRATILVYTTSIWIIPLTMILHRKVRKVEIGSFFIGILGIIIMICPWRPEWYQSDLWLADLYLILSAFVWAIGILCARHLKWYRTPLQLLPWELILCAIVTGILSALQGIALIPPKLSWALWGSLLYSGTIVIAIGQWIMLVVSKNLNPSIVSFGIIWIPLVSVIISALFLHEKIDSWLIGGMLLIMLGILLHIYSEKKSERKSRT